jgi:hypothetical protein
VRSDDRVFRHRRAVGTSVVVMFDNAGPGFDPVLACSSTASRATASVSTDAAGQIRSSVADVKFDGGHACFYNRVRIHLVVDVQGYLAPDAIGCRHATGRDTHRDTTAGSVESRDPRKVRPNAGLPSRRDCRTRRRPRPANRHRRAADTARSSSGGADVPVTSARQRHVTQAIQPSWSSSLRHSTSVSHAQTQ